jgi:hypothetical protein
MNYLDSSSDEDMMEVDELLNLMIPRKIRDRSNPFTEYSDMEFRMRFRLRKQTVQTLMHRIINGLTDSTRNRAVSPLNRLLVTLRFYASSSFQVKK